jgi:hypothetical protein
LEVGSCGIPFPGGFLQPLMIDVRCEKDIKYPA